MSAPLINYILELYQSGYTDKELLSLIKKYSIEFTKEDIDTDFMSDMFTPFLEMQALEKPSSQVEVDEVLVNTLNQYFPQDYENYKIIKNHLLKLCLYDKLVIRDNKQYFFLIDLLLINYTQHLEALDEWNRLDRLNDTTLSGVALSRSTAKKSILSSHYNQVTSMLKTMPSNDELLTRKKVYDEHLIDSYATNYMLHTIDLVGSIKSMSQDKYNNIIGSRKVLNSESPLKRKDIYKSANISILNLFSRKTSKLSYAKLIEINEVLMQNIFGVGNKINTKNISNIIQVKTNFLTDEINMPIYEFQTKINKKVHPMYEDNEFNQEYWDEITEFFKEKIPLKQPS